MKNGFKTASALRAIPAGFAVIRTPLLPFDHWSGLGDGLRAAPTSQASKRSYAAQRTLVRSRVAGLVKRQDFREAVFLAAPELERELAEGCHAPDSERGIRLESSILRYLARACGRATPFGLFAGCSLVPLGATTKLLVGRPEECERKTRLDMGYLDAVVGALATSKDSLRSASLFPNETLYKFGDGLRYVQCVTRANQRSYELVAVEETDHLRRALALAAAGETMAGLAAALVADNPGLAREDAEEFVGELVESQILVSNLRLAITGEPAVETLLRNLAGRDGAAATVLTNALRRALAHLAVLDAAGPGASRERYIDLAKLLETLPVPPPAKNLVQVDMMRPAPDAQLGSDVVAELARGAAAIQFLARDAAVDSLSDFKRAFTARYEDREVPLVEVLDEDAGIGFGSNDPAASQEGTVRGMVFPPKRPGNPEMTGAQILIARKLSEGTGMHQDEIELSEEEIASSVVASLQPPPAAFCVAARLAATSAHHRSRRDYSVYVQGILPGAKLLGRFCHTLPGLNQAVDALLQREESDAPDAMHAEIVHLPAGRIGNVLARPVLRDYEIPFLGKSGAAQTRQIPVDDLLISVRRDRVLLRSASTGREVRPHQTTAHNALNGLAVYRFLCALENQGAVTGGLPLGPLAALTYLPRITCGRIVLSLRRWNFTRDQLLPILSTASNALLDAVVVWRQQWRLPRHVLLVEGDNELPVDLEQVLSVEGLFRLIHQRERVALAEMFPAPSQLVVTDGTGRYVAELIVPFSCPADPSSPHAVLGPPCPSGERRHPGDQWVYVKLYSGVAAVDALVRGVLPDLVRELREHNLIERWFFVRYGDPDGHLRLRFKATRNEAVTVLLRAIRKNVEAYLHDGRVWRMQIDTYDPELRRYGGPNAIGLAEEAFEADSDAALSILRACSAGDLPRALCWGLSRFPDDFGFSPAETLALWQRVRSEFASEFAADASVEDQLSRRYRHERRDYERPPGDAVLAAFGLRSVRLRQVATELKKLEHGGELTSSMQSIVGSLVHMSANRVLRTSARAQELVLYDFLLRATRSHQARRSPLPAAAGASS